MHILTVCDLYVELEVIHFPCDQASAIKHWFELDAHIKGTAYNTNLCSVYVHTKMHTETSDTSILGHVL